MTGSLRPPPSLVANLLASCFALVLLLGGSAQFFLPNDMPARLVACFMLLVITWCKLPVKSDRFSLVLLGAVALLPIIQLVPISGSIWSAIPGREPLNDVLAAANVAPHAQVSLAPSRTMDAILFLIIPIAGFLLGNVVFGIDRYLLLKYVVGVAVVSVLFSVIQIVQGEGGSAFLYRVTNEGSAVGIFANRNHNGTLMAVAIALLIPLIDRELRSRKPSWTSAMLLVGLAFVFLSTAITTQSRAGMVLAFVAFATLLWKTSILQKLMEFLHGKGNENGGIALSRPIRVSLAAVGFFLVAVILWVLVASGADLRFVRLADESFNRTEVYELTVRAIADHWLTGSGIGSFQWAITPYEEFSRVSFTYWNHAHSDLLQLVMEGGVLAVMLIASFAFWLIRMALRIFRTAGMPEANRSCAFGMTFAIMLTLAHSILDYPLRTAAIATIFAMCCGCIAACSQAAARSA